MYNVRRLSSWLALKLLMDEVLPALAKVLLTHEMIRSSPTASPSLFPRPSRIFRVYLHIRKPTSVRFQSQPE